MVFSCPRFQRALPANLFERLLIVVQRYPPVGQLETLQLPKASGEELEERQQTLIINNKGDSVGVDVGPVQREVQVGQVGETGQEGKQVRTSQDQLLVDGQL